MTTGGDAITRWTLDELTGLRLDPDSSRLEDGVLRVTGSVALGDLRMVRRAFGLSASDRVTVTLVVEGVTDYTYPGLIEGDADLTVVAMAPQSGELRLEGEEGALRILLADPAAAADPAPFEIRGIVRDKYGLLAPGSLRIRPGSRAQMANGGQSPGSRFRSRLWNRIQLVGRWVAIVLWTSMTLILVVLGINGIMSLGEPVVWGTFTEEWREDRARGRDDIFGTWVSDDGTEVWRGVGLSGGDPGGGSITAGFRRSQPYDYVYTAQWIDGAAWAPPIAAVAFAAIGLVKLRSWKGELRWKKERERS